MARKTDQPSTSRKTSKRAVAPMVVSRDEQPAAQPEPPPPPPTMIPRASSPSILISAELRAHMIAEGAYYRAAARGFEPGYEVEDWLAAEAAIDDQLTN